jgi:L-ascorbate metabolism protein UlaG (beta-lactamase superfamily)
MSNLRGTTVTWLGHATVLIQTAGGTSILIDPFIEHNPKFPKGFKLPEKLDLMILSHAHGDHTADVVPVAKRSHPTVLGMVELAGWFAGKGVEKTVGINLGGSFKLKDVTATMVEAKHSSSIQDGDGFVYGGVATGFVLKIEGGPVLYHAGDTCAFSDMRLIRELHAPEFGMLPIGDHYTMGPKEAALAAELLGLKSILPIHFGTFPALTGTPEQLKKALDQRNLSAIEVLHVKPGEAVR